MSEKNKLKGRMVELKMGQIELANKVDMAVSTLNLKLVGKRDFKLEEIKAIIKVLDIPENEIAKYFF